MGMTAALLAGGLSSALASTTAAAIPIAVPTAVTTGVTTGAAGALAGGAGTVATVAPVAAAPVAGGGGAGIFGTSLTGAELAKDAAIGAGVGGGTNMISTAAQGGDVGEVFTALGTGAAGGAITGGAGSLLGAALPSATGAAAGAAGGSTAGNAAVNAGKDAALQGLVSTPEYGLEGGVTLANASQSGLSNPIAQALGQGSQMGQITAEGTLAPIASQGANFAPLSSTWGSALEGAGNSLADMSGQIQTGSKEEERQPMPGPTVIRPKPARPPINTQPSTNSPYYDLLMKARNRRSQSMGVVGASSF